MTQQALPQGSPCSMRHPIAAGASASSPALTAPGLCWQRSHCQQRQAPAVQSTTPGSANRVRWQRLSASLPQIRHNILNIFNPHRHPHQPIRNPQLRPALRPHGRMRHRRRMTDQRLHPTQRLSQQPSFSRLANRLAFSNDPSSTEIIDPNPVCCLFARSCCGWSFSPG